MYFLRLPISSPDPEKELSSLASGEGRLIVIDGGNTILQQVQHEGRSHEDHVPPLRIANEVQDSQTGASEEA
jgi:hypothetical protein